MKSLLALLVFSCLSCGNGDPPAPIESGGAGGEAGASGESCDQDRDGHETVTCGGDDCDDARIDIFPGADDVCDGDDNDCDEVVDPGDVCDCAEPPPDERRQQLLRRTSDDVSRGRLDGAPRRPAGGPNRVGVKSGR